MTCKEKLSIEHPYKVSVEYKGGCYGCPYDYGYAYMPEYCKDRIFTTDEKCKACWDREANDTNEAVIFKTTVHVNENSRIEKLEQENKHLREIIHAVEAIMHCKILED